MEKKKKHSFKVRQRAFAIWQKLGYFPWRKKKEKKEKKGSGDFYKGAFDSIPFLNEDAKRTFTHLLLRPGYMIRDYIKGDHERYLAPFTSLIIFYAFFALVAAVMQPVQQKGEIKSPFHVDVSQDDLDEGKDTELFNQAVEVINIYEKGWTNLHLDLLPEEVDTQFESSLAALEGTLRNQGIPLFIGKFFFLWLAMAWAFRRRHKMKMSATAAASAYILCQFSFFMLFALLLSFGKSAEIGLVLMLALLVWDYHQWLGLGYKKSFWLSVSTGIRYIILYVGFYLLAAGVVILFNSLRS
jgi:hypothetical protein